VLGRGTGLLLGLGGQDLGLLLGRGDLLGDGLLLGQGLFAALLPLFVLGLQLAQAGWARWRPSTT
jgi:hypothetical protein